MPNTINEIYSGFSKCTSLTHVLLSDNINTIPMSCFEDCSSLQSVNLHENCQYIRSFAFQRSGIYKIAFPQSVKDIEGACFMDCKFLKEVDLRGTFDFLSNQLFRGCSALEKIKITSNITHLDRIVFKDCTSLTELEIEDSGEPLCFPYNWYFFHDVFEGCQLNSVYIGRNIGAYPLYAGAEYEVIDPVLSANDWSPFYGQPISSVEFGPLVTTLSAALFLECDKLTNVNLSPLITEIQGAAFKNCKNLYKIIWPENLRYIGYETFMNTGFTSLTIPAQVTEIDNYAFKGCKGLKSITFGDKLIKLGEGALSEDEALQSITVGAKTPPEVPYQYLGLSQEQYQTVILQVPSGTRDIYATTSPWSNFFNIEEFSAGIYETEIPGVDVYINSDKSITISGGKLADITIYDVNGRKVYEGPKGTITGLISGFYIITDSYTTKKFILK